MKWEFLPATEFHGHHELWDRLNDCNTNSPLLEARFVQSGLDSFGTDNEYLAICKNSDGLVAATILSFSRMFITQTFQPSQVPIGLWVQTPDLDRSRSITALFKALPIHKVLISLLQLDPDLIHREENTPNSNSIDYITTARLIVNGDFETYWNQRGKNLKRNKKKIDNRLKNSELECALECITSQADVDSALSDYEKLEDSGWKGESGTAITVHNEQGKFYSTLLKRYAETGDLSIFKYTIGNEIAAVDLCILRDSTLVILKTTYNEELKQYSPALMMHIEIIKRIFERNDSMPAIIEFYGRTMDWHRRLTDNTRELFHMNYYRFSMLQNVHVALSGMNRVD